MRYPIAYPSVLLGALLTVSPAGAAPYTGWNINIPNENFSCDLIAYYIEGLDDSFGNLRVGFHFVAENVSVPGHVLPKGEPFLLIESSAKPGKQSSYVKPRAVSIDNVELPSYQWAEDGEFDQTFYYVTGQSAVDIFEASRNQESILITFKFEPGNEQRLEISTGLDTSFPIFADMLVTCGRSITK